MAEQKELNTGVCDHLIDEPVTTYGGTVIAYRCKGCAKLLCHYGKCDGCKKIQKLSVFKGTGRSSKRFCTEQCKSRAMTRWRKLAKKELGK